MEGNETDKKNEFLQFIRRFQQDLGVIIKKNNLTPNFSRFSGEHFDANPHLLTQLSSLYNRLIKRQNQLMNIKFVSGDPWCDSFIKDFQLMKDKLKGLVSQDLQQSLTAKKTINNSTIRFSNDQAVEEERKRKEAAEDIAFKRSLLKQAKEENEEIWQSQVTAKPVQKSNCCLSALKVIIIIVIIIAFLTLLLMLLKHKGILKEIPIVDKLIYLILQKSKAKVTL